MTDAVSCPACGEVNGVQLCSACGAEMSNGAVGGALEQIHPTRDRDQTRADRDQTSSDRDQTSSDRDQTASESDQRRSDEDQQAAEHELAAGGDEATYRRGALARERSSSDRNAMAALRDENAAARRRTADDRDRAAELRQLGADEAAAVDRLDDLFDDPNFSRDELLRRVERDRARAAADRAKAAEDRARAAADREEAARERAEALRTRVESENTLRHATTDELTGVWTRKFGLEELTREIERAHRTGDSLVLAFVDVDGLKQVNDTEGHLAGDALLQLAGETLRGNVRPYDVIVRYGGDEFVCGMPNISASEARARFVQIATALAAVNPEHSISFGLAETEPADTLLELIARADADLLDARRVRKSTT